MNLRLISFTDGGQKLARHLAEALGGTADRGVPAAEWTKEYFHTCDALIFVGAAGIAVRSIAPCLKNKTVDPAVVVVDEHGQYAIPILSGHLGGANDLARRISQICGAVPVITTSTDVNKKFAVDEWAKRQNCLLQEPDRILPVSSRILKGETITVTSDWPITGNCPEGVALSENGLVRLSLKADDSNALHLIPRIGVLGVGCKRNTSPELIGQVFKAFLTQNQLNGACITQVCSIDRKADEPGLLSFCRDHGWTLKTFSAEELAAVKGDFSSSAFVAETVGVDNVCERAAVLGCASECETTRWVRRSDLSGALRGDLSGALHGDLSEALRCDLSGNLRGDLSGNLRSDLSGTSTIHGTLEECEVPAACEFNNGSGTLIARKFAEQGVTMALAVKPYAPDWRWQYE